MPAGQPFTSADLARWPASAEKVEIILGGLLYSGRFTGEDAAAARRTYPLHEVYLDDQGMLRAQAADVREAGKRRLLEAGGRKEIAMMVPVVFLVLAVPNHHLNEDRQTLMALRRHQIEPSGPRRHPPPRRAPLGPPRNLGVENDGPPLGAPVCQ
ncbi:hypothetical protein [Geodermatophilus africanus]|uniref:hypothetical protein n=1 Tax=Geodermatophilus africanus TaxID=1137993 RepID=UPI000B0696F3|nr:hypothetical protein [Geodermatophilus africanus]